MRGRSGVFLQIMAQDHSLAVPSTQSSSLARASSPSAWARDLAVVGGVSSVASTIAFAPAMVVPVGMYALIAGATGVLTGALLGVVAGKAIAGPLARLPVLAVLAGGVGAGAVWGGTVGAIAALALGAHGMVLESSIEIAAVAGAIQLGWWWLPYLLRRAHEKSTWPVVFFAACLSPFLGWIGLFVLSWLYRFL
jgi:hypothetical protein